MYVHGKDEASDFSILEEIPQGKKVIADLLAPDAVEQLFTQIPELDVLVNNAGMVNRSKEKTIEDFQKIFQLHATVPYFLSLEAKKRGVKSIVNVGSMRALEHCATTPDYSASKAALHNLTISLARTLAPETRVNAVAPGFTETKMHDGNSERLETEAKRTPLQRAATPDEIAEAIFFLASPAASFITGEILRVDGGRNFYGA